MTATSEIATADLREEARDQQSAAVALRRTLHSWPEVGNDLPLTREHVLEALEGLPLDITQHESTSGLAALLTGAKPGPTILLRGDMDALPLHEDTGLDFGSRFEGAMHACGHDTHTAMLVASARLLSAHRDDLAGRVLFMFQPGEEGEHGARFMLEEGLLDLPPLADGTPSPITPSVRDAHHVGVADRLDELQARRVDGLRRQDLRDRHRSRRPRQRARIGRSIPSP